MFERWKQFIKNILTVERKNVYIMWYMQHVWGTFLITQQKIFYFYCTGMVDICMFRAI